MKSKSPCETCKTKDSCPKICPELEEFLESEGLRDFEAKDKSDKKSRIVRFVSELPKHTYDDGREDGKEKSALELLEDKWHRKHNKPVKDFLSDETEDLPPDETDDFIDSWPFFNDLENLLKQCHFLCYKHIVKKFIEQPRWDLTACASFVEKLEEIDKQNSKGLELIKYMQKAKKDKGIRNKIKKRRILWDFWENVFITFYSRDAWIYAWYMNYYPDYMTIEQIANFFRISQGRVIQIVNKIDKHFFGKKRLKRPRKGEIASDRLENLPGTIDFHKKEYSDENSELYLSVWQHIKNHPNIIRDFRAKSKNPSKRTPRSLEKIA